MTDTATLIPRTALFGNPTRAAGQISPDGQWLSWLAPKDGVLNIWLAPASDPQAARAITHAVERPIRQYFWSPDASAAAIASGPCALLPGYSRMPFAVKQAARASSRPRSPL